MTFKGVVLEWAESLWETVIMIQERGGKSVESIDEAICAYEM